MKNIPIIFFYIVLSARVQAQEVSNYHLVTANEYIKAGKYTNAIIELDSAIKLSPHYSEPYELKGDIYKALKSDRKAVGQYSLAILYNTNNVQVYLKRAALHYKLKDHRNYILNDINEAINLEPNNADLYQLKSFYYAHTFNPNTLKPDFENAILSLSRAINLNPKKPIYYYFRSDYKLKNKQTLSSLIDINKALELENSNDTYYHQRAIVRFVMTSFRSSLDDINKALEINNSSILYYQFRGNIYYNLKKYDRSYQDYSVAINLIFDRIIKTNKKINSTSSINLQLRQTLLLRGMASVQANKPFDGCNDFNKALQMGESKAKNYIRQYCN